MSVDIIEIALDGLTDSTDFEKLASEIMRDEGYPDIKPLGGTGDMGQDAGGDRYFLSEGRTRVVFQYTLQQTLPSKIEDTIEKLAANNIEYSELVIVTHLQISSQRQIELTREVRRKHGVTLVIYERKTLVNRLADYESGIFHRHFPDVHKQIADLTAKQPLLSHEGSSLHEVAMLKISMITTFGKEAARARKSVFDHMILAMSLENPKEGMQVDKLSEHYRNIIGEPPVASQIKASLQRLSARGLVSCKGDYVRPTNFALQTAESCTIQANQATDALISDIIDNMCRITGGTLSDEVRRTIARNTRDVLVELLRLFGIEIANQVLGDSTPVYLVGGDILLSNAKRQLPPQLGELLIATIGETISSPTEEQAETLAGWALAYLGAEIMHLDPNLKEFQASRFKKKTFILDTDFVLDCLVRERAISNVYLNLVRNLKDFGCKVIIPQCCIDECTTHARFSPRAYRYFGQSLLSLSKTLVDQEVRNVFVQGYYHGRVNGVISAQTTFEEYMRNYYEPTDPGRFLRQAIQLIFPKGVDIVDPSTLLTQDIPAEQLTILSDKLLQLILKSKKGEHRTNEENQEFATTDAKLFLTTLYLNGGPGSTSGHILGGEFYLITASGRYLRSANSVGVRDVVTARPQSLIALLDLVGGTRITPSQFTSLFENPLLMYSVAQAWDDVKGLVQSGIELQGKSLARLMWDLDGLLHQKIVAVTEADARADAAEEPAPDAGDSEYIDLLRSAASRGYRRIPEVESLMEELEKARSDAAAKDKEIDDLLAKHKELEKAITHFGKRKQRYLKRVAAERMKQ